MHIRAFTNIFKHHIYKIHLWVFPLGKSIENLNVYKQMIYYNMPNLSCYRETIVSIVLKSARYAQQKIKLC